MAEHTEVPVPQALWPDEHLAFYDAMERLSALGHDKLVVQIGWGLRQASLADCSWHDDSAASRTYATLALLADVAAAGLIPV